MIGWQIYIIYFDPLIFQLSGFFQLRIRTILKQKWVLIKYNMQSWLNRRADKSLKR